VVIETTFRARPACLYFLIYHALCAVPRSI
jgi:hypothetical protein